MSNEVASYAVNIEIAIDVCLREIRLLFLNKYC